MHLLSRNLVVLALARPLGYTLGGYAAVFFALLAPFWLTDTLPGNCDTYLALALSHSYIDDVLRLFGANIGRALYPWPDVHTWGEASPLGALLVVVPTVMGFAPTTAYLLALGAVLVGTAACTFAVARELGASTAAAAFAGLAFPLSNLFLAHIDDPIMMAWSIPLGAWWLLERGSTHNRPRWVLAAGALAGVQVYLSVYVFVMQGMMLGAWCVSKKIWRRSACSPKRLVAAGALAILVSAPAFFWYLQAADQAMTQPPVEQRQTMATQQALGPADWFSALPNNRVLPNVPLSRHGANYWIDIRKRVFFGWTILVLAAIGLVFSAHRRFLIMLALAGLLLGWRGTTIGSWQIPATGVWLSELWALTGYFRILSRAHFLVALAATLSAAMGIDWLIRRWRIPALATVAGLCALHVFENVPAPMHAHDATWIAPPALVRETFKNQPQLATLLDLPTSLMFGDGGEDRFTYAREVVYVLWQTDHEQNSVNGASGYIPRDRGDLDQIVARLPSEWAVGELRRRSVTHLVFHRDLILSPKENVLDELTRSPLLELTASDDDTYIFGLR